MGLFASHKNTSDEELMRLYVNGSKGAFEEIYHRYSRRLLHFMFKMLNNDEEKAQDLLQDLFMKILERPGMFDASRNFKSWIFTVAANQCRNEYRKNHYVEFEADITLSNEATDSYKQLIAQMDKDVFKKQLKIELNRLSRDHKTVFILRIKEEFSIREIAEIMDCSAGTVKSRIFYCVRILARRLKEFHPLKTN
ncbi:MAG: RNA polymerase sigma factor [Flavobacteriales bacterium]|nr:RNA polymerase sigma factor [Flavobacteriales bacterium]